MCSVEDECSWNLQIFTFCFYLLFTQHPNLLRHRAALVCTSIQELQLQCSSFETGTASLSPCTVYLEFRCIFTTFVRTNDVQSESGLNWECRAEGYDATMQLLLPSAQTAQESQVFLFSVRYISFSTEIKPKDPEGFWWRLNQKLFANQSWGLSITNALFFTC